MPVSGPMGWPYPILNFFLGLFENMGRRKELRPIRERESLPTRPITRPIMTNLEEVTWTDWKGRERKMSIHREVR